MKPIKDFVIVCSDWLLGQIQTRIIGAVFVIVSSFEAVNRLGLSHLFLNPNASHAMDMIWLVNFVFATIAAANWLVREIWRGLQRF